MLTKLAALSLTATFALGCAAASDPPRRAARGVSIEAMGTTTELRTIDGERFAVVRAKGDAPDFLAVRFAPGTNVPVAAMLVLGDASKPVLLKVGGAPDQSLAVEGRSVDAALRTFATATRELAFTPPPLGAPIAKKDYAEPCQPNGCTWSPDGWWKECCDAHDCCYADPSRERLACDWELTTCISGQATPIIGGLYGAATALFGWAFHDDGGSGSGWNDSRFDVYCTDEYGTYWAGTASSVDEAVEMCGGFENAE